MDFESDRWSNYLEERSRAVGTVAISADGSRMSRAEVEDLRWYAIPFGGYALEALHLPAQNASFRIDPSERTILEYPCGGGFSAPRLPAATDAECAMASRIHLPEGRQAGRGRIAGYAVVRYRQRKGAEETEVALAPAAGCDVLEYRETTYGALGLARSRFRFRAMRYRQGEPERRLFELPPGYRIRRME